MLPQREHWYTSLKAKVTFLITILSLTGLGFLIAMFLAMERKTLAEFQQEKMLFVENFVGITLTPIMITGQAAKIMPLMVENYKHMTNMKNLKIIRATGEEAFVDDKTIKAVNDFLFEDKFQRDNVRPAKQVLPSDDPRLKKVSETLEKLVYTEKFPDGTETTHMMIPFLNKRDCHTCHGKTDKIRGVLLASFSMEKVKFKIKNDMLLLSGIAFIGVLLMSLSMFFMFNRIVVSPTATIVKEVNSLLLKEKYDTRITVKSDDEVGDIARVLNYFIESVEDFRFKQAEENVRLEKAVAVRTKELKEKNDFIENDLKLASRIQTKLLPEKFPEVPGMSFHATYLPCLYIGGDFYDVFEMGNKHIGIFLADASGHGSSAALLVSIVKALISTIGKDISSPSYVIQLVNKTLSKLTPDDSYITLFYGIVNYETGRMLYSLAGHPSPYIYNKFSKELTTLETNGGLVGIFESDTFADAEYFFKDGDRMIVYTDGILEAHNNSKEMFGKERLISILKENSQITADKVNKILLDDLSEYTGGAALADDMTILFTDFDSTV